VNAAEAFIRKEIETRGPLPFSRFMELALYHPEHGYYSKVSPLQDYYTSADVHPLFAKILAGFILKEWRERFPGEPEVTIIELGCGWGKLAKGILDAIAEQDPGRYAKTRYIGVETSALRRKNCESENAGHGDRAVFRPSFDFPDGSVRGFVLSNEFFDALPVGRVRNEAGGELREIFVGKDFKEVLQKPSPSTAEYLDWLGRTPQPGCEGETHASSREWMRKISRSLHTGTILTIDYGHEAEELYAPIRPQGTLLCHFRHQSRRDFYGSVGEQDLTAHVNFTALTKEGRAWGMEPSPLQTQSAFLLEHGTEQMLSAVNAAKDPKERLRASSAAKSLIHPEGMGGTFKVLVQRKSGKIVG
jgi:SAM-dependent MidA family methyltransferase